MAPLFGAGSCATGPGWPPWLPDIPQGTGLQQGTRHPAAPPQMKERRGMRPSILRVPSLPEDDVG